MASACVKNIGMSPEKFLDRPPSKFPSSYGWLSPRISFSRDFPDEEKLSTKNQAMAEKPGEPDLNISSNDFADFEFCLEDPVGMLPADELFADGKLVPRHLATIRHSMASAKAAPDVIPSETLKSRRRNELSSSSSSSSMDPYLFSPKAPRCSSRWKELLGLKKLYSKQEDLKTTSSLLTSNKTPASRGLKHFLHHRSSKSSDSSSLSLPLLKESDNESMSISARLSLSSSSSGHEHDDLPRLSLDSDKPAAGAMMMSSRTGSNLSRVRVVKHRTALSSENPTARARVGRSTMKRAPETADPARGVSVDSPRMNSSGKIVFHSLERSSSSPSTFNGGPRHKHRGMERSYSANVRVKPVLNVPVCSLRGSSKSGVFGLFSSSSQQKKESGGGVRSQHNRHCRSRTDRTT